MLNNGDASENNKSEPKKITIRMTKNKYVVIYILKWLRIHGWTNEETCSQRNQRHTEREKGREGGGGEKENATSRQQKIQFARTLHWTTGKRAWLPFDLVRFAFSVSARVSPIDAYSVIGSQTCCVKGSQVKRDETDGYKSAAVCW